MIGTFSQISTFSCYISIYWFDIYIWQRSTQSLGPWEHTPSTETDFDCHSPPSPTSATCLVHPPLLVHFLKAQKGYLRRPEGLLVYRGPSQRREGLPKQNACRDNLNLYCSNGYPPQLLQWIIASLRAGICF